MWPPSPALMTGTEAAREATSAAALLRVTDGDGVDVVDTVLMVSAIDSPLVTEASCAPAKPMTLPPRRSMAVSKLRRVRVLGS